MGILKLLRAVGLFLFIAAGLFGPAPADAESRVTILALGDSLTAGYGLAQADSLPSQLEAALRAGGRDVRIINAGVSGDTTAGGRARVAWSLAAKPDAVIVALGANDGLRGLAPTETAANLDALIGEIRGYGQNGGLPVLLAGMLAPPNLGDEYGAAFNAVFPRLAKTHGVVFYPFLLDGVVARQDLNQDDGIHPNEAGVIEIVRRIMPKVIELLDTAKAVK